MNKHIFRRKKEKQNSQEGLLKMNPIILLIFCLFMYPPLLMSAPSIIPSMIYGVSLLYVFFNFKHLSRAVSSQFGYVILLIVLISLSLFIPSTRSTNDFSYFSIMLSVVEKILTYSALVIMISKAYGPKDALKYFMYYFAAVHAVYVIGTIILVLIPSAKEFWFNIFSMESEDIYLRTSKFMFRIGWCGFAGFRLTLYCTISIIFLFYLRYASSEKKIRTIEFILLFVLCLLGNMFYGRVGLVLTILNIAIAVVYWNKKHIRKILAFLVLTAGVIMTIVALKDVPLFNSWYKWMSEPIINLFTTGEFNDASFDTLQEMNRVDISTETFLLGDGYYNKDGEYYMRTDAGYFRNILFWGIFGGIISYGLTIILLLRTIKIDKIMALQLLLTFVFFEYKGAVYYEFIVLGTIIGMTYYVSSSDLKNRIKAPE